MIRLLLLLFISSFSFSQNEFNEQGERIGLWMGYHGNGDVKYRGHFLNGQESGLFKYYDYGGNLVIELDYVELGVRSNAILYYSNGVIQSKGEYLNKKKHNTWMYYNYNGEKIAEESFLHNQLHGASNYFYKNGKLSEKYMYLNNFKHGEAEIYYKSGFLNIKCNYNLGELDGFSESYYDKIKQLESKGKYNMGVKDSIWIFYNESGDTLDLYDYTNNRSLYAE